MDDTKEELADVPVVILCGGEGTRFREETQFRPKPLVEIGEFPILWHVMSIYARHGFKNFILCLGYKGSMIKDFFLNYEIRSRDFVLSMDDGSHQFVDAYNKKQGVDWKITFVETGSSTMTGGRVKRVKHLIPGDRFMLTYADGVADIDIGALYRAHLDSGALGTVTGVKSASQFGELLTNGSHITGFSEKPMIDSIINGGFFVFERKFFEYLSRDVDCILEKTPLERLANDGELSIYLHKGFWQCLDTYKDFRFLNETWDTGEAPWGGQPNSGVKPE